MCFQHPSITCNLSFLQRKNKQALDSEPSIGNMSRKDFNAIVLLLLHFHCYSDSLFVTSKTGFIYGSGFTKCSFDLGRKCELM